MKLSWHRLENLQTTLALLRLEPNRPLPLSMRGMTKKRRQRRSVARVTARMTMSVAYVRIHNAGQTRIGSIESWAVRPGSMRASPNQEARLLSEA
jgi:hypothetical protein